MLCRETKRPRRPGLRVFQIHPRTLGSSRGLAVRDNPHGSHRPNNGLGHPASAIPPTTTMRVRRNTAFIGTPPMLVRLDSLELVSKPLPPHVRPEQAMGCFQISSRPPPSGTSPSRDPTVPTESALQAQHRWNRTALVPNPETITVRNERTPPHARETGCGPGTRSQTPHATPTRQNQKTRNAEQTESQCPRATRARASLRLL